MKKYKHAKKIIGIALLIVVAITATCLAPGGRQGLFNALTFAKAVTQSYLPMGDGDVRNLRQVITQNIHTSRTIMWDSTLSETDSMVEYRVVGEDSWKSVAATNKAFTGKQQTFYTHMATLNELKENTEYEYRVGSGNKRSDAVTFSTGNGGNFRAIIFPDSQSSDYRDWDKIAKYAWEHNKDASFFINMGDLVDNGQDDSQWNAWFGAVEPMIQKIPVAPILGNHEMYSLDWKMAPPDAYLNHFSLPDNGTNDYKGRFYSYEVNDVHFTVIDTQFQEAKDFLPNLQEDEVAWLRNDLATAKTKWKVILLHRDVLAYGSVRLNREAGISETGQIFMPIFDEFNVDLVFSAHLHTYRNRGHIQDFVRNEAGPAYILTGVAGNVRYSNLWREHPLDIAIAPQPETDNFITMDKDNTSLTITAYLSDGTVIDKYRIEK